MSNNTRAFAQARQERDDAEIEAWEKSREKAAEDAKVDEIPADNSDAAAWKKRHGDTRRAWERDNQAAKAREAELLAEIEKLRSSSNSAMPVDNEEEFKEWVAKYPKVGSFVNRMVQEQVSAALQGQEKRLAKVDELENKLSAAEASKLLAKLQPDFFGDEKGLLENGETAILYRADFQEWLDDQDSEDREIMNQGRDAKKASRIINDWKSQVGYGQSSKPKTKSRNTADAASSVRTTSTSPVSENPQRGDYDFTESQIENMSQREYEALEDKIESAQAAGRFLYDLSS